MAFKDDLVSLGFKSVRIAPVQLKRSQKCARAGKLAFGLRYDCLLDNCIRVIGRNVEDFLELSKRFRKLAAIFVGECVLGKEGNVARVEAFGLVEVSFASLPL